MLNSGLHCHGVSDGTVLERSSFRSSLLTSGTSAHSINSHCADLELAPGCGTCQAPLPCCEWTLGSCRCGALRPTHSLLPLWEHGCTVGIDRDHPCGPPSRDDGGYQSASSLWIVERGVVAVVMWSCGVIERCVNMSISQNKPKLQTGYQLGRRRGGGGRGGGGRGGFTTSPNPNPTPPLFLFFVFIFVFFIHFSIFSFFQFLLFFNFFSFFFFFFFFAFFHFPFVAFFEMFFCIFSFFCVSLIFFILVVMFLIFLFSFSSF